MSILKSTRSSANVNEPGLVSLASVNEALSGLDSSKAMTPAGTKAVIDALIGGAPELLDTLNELAQAINDDETFATTVQSQLTNLQNQINSVSGGGASNQVELDDTQAGAGLAANGDYVQNTSANYIQAATSLADADDKLDAQIAANATAISSLGSGNIAALQSELDATQASSGLNSDGTFTANSSSNFIGSATTVRGEINALDTQVKTNADAITNLASSSAISNLQSEVDDTQVGVGLSVDGDHVARSGTNYLDSASNVVGEITLLDAQVKTNEDAIATKASSSSLTALQSEVDANQSSLGLSSNGALTYSSTPSNFSASATLKEAVEALDSAVDTKASSSTVSGIDTNLTAVEASVGLASNGTLASYTSTNYISGTIKAALEALDAQVNTNATDIGGLSGGSGLSGIQAEVDAIEASIGLNTDGTLGSYANNNYYSASATVKAAIAGVDAQVSQNATAIASNDTDISGLTTSLASKADSSTVVALSSTVDDVEASVGLTADGGFTANSGGNYISSATSVRGEINALDTQVATNAGDISNLSSTVSTLTSAGSANASEITALENEIDATQAGAGLGTTGAYAANSGSNYLTAASSLKDADNKLDAQIKTNETAISNKAASSTVSAIDTRLTAAESAITGNDGDISSLQSDVSANTTAISGNDTDISALQSSKADATVTTALQTELDATQVGVGLNANGSYTAISGADYATSSSSLKAAVEQLDTQLASTQGDLDTAEASLATAQSDITGLQSEIDATQTGSGLGTNGAYTADSSTNYLTSASSLKDADDKLDAQIKTNEDDIASETSARNSAISGVNSSISTLQSEVDATQTGAGLNANGSYTADSSSNYITSAGTLKAADSLLDTQIKTNADGVAVAQADISSINSSLSTKASSSSVSALQTEVDAIETGVGLSSSGTYQTPGSSNFLGGSTVKAELVLLDTQIKDNEDDIATKASSSSLTALQSELDVSQAAVGLNTNGSYTALTGNYNTASTIKGAISGVDTQVKTNADSIATKASSSSLSTLQSEVDATQSGAGLAANGNFVAYSGTNFIDGTSSLAGAIEELDTQVKTRQDNINSEASTRASADTTLQGAIDTIEASVGLGTDGSLTITGTNFLNSSSTIVAALSTLDTNQNLLSGIRTNMIAALGLSTTGEKGSYANTNYISDSEDVIEAIEALDRQVNTNASSISSLGSSNIAALQSELDATQTGAGLDTDGGYTADSSTDYLTSATSLKDADDKLDAQIKTNEDAIATKANSTTVSALDLRLTQIELSGGGLWNDETGDEVSYEFKARNLRSHIGPFQILLGGFNGLIAGGGDTSVDLIMYPTVAERDGDRHFHVHPTTGDIIFQGKYSS